MKLVVKNMVCPRCISSVEQALEMEGISFSKVSLGEIELENQLRATELQQLSLSLKKNGFELLDDKNQQLIEKVKSILIQKAQSGDVEEHFSISKLLTDKVFREYSSVSKLFSEVEGLTIEHFFIMQKIEKVKEYLMYKELTLNEIAFKMGYSSPQHLSSQFKKHTGMTPSQFKLIGASLRKNLNEVC